MLPTEKLLSRIVDAGERIIIAAIATRNTIPLFSTIGIILIAFILGKEKLSEILLELVGNRILCAGGWILLSVSIVLEFKIVTWINKEHRAEMRHYIDLKDDALKGQLNLPMNQGDDDS